MRKNTYMGKRLMITGLSLAMAFSMAGMPVSAQGPGQGENVAMMDEKQGKEAPPAKPDGDNQDRETPPAKSDEDKQDREAPPEKPDGNNQDRETPPEKPEGDTSEKEDAAPEKPEGDTSEKEDAAPEKPEGDTSEKKDAAPEKPEGDTSEKKDAAPEKPEGDTSEKKDAAPEKPEGNDQGQNETAPGTANNANQINIVAPSSNIAAGKKVKLFALNNPAKQSGGDVTWTSSNKNYATVDENGLVTTKKAGEGKEVTITAKSQDGKAAGEYTIKVKKDAVKAVKITGKSNVKAGKTVQLKATATASKGAYKTLKWSSSNKKYATVNAKGLVKAKKAGKGKTVTITAAALDGSNKKAVKKITIK